MNLPGARGRINVRGLAALCRLRSFTAPFLSLAMALAGPCYATPLKSHLTHYGSWKDADIPMFRRFGMVALQPGMYSGTSQEVQAIAQIRSQGALVLMYISLGEDADTYNNAAPAKGDGRGPVHGSASGPVYGNKGIASYYLDEWNAKGWDADSVNKVPDGLPDRQGDWGSCYVNAGDSAWQRKVLEQAAKLMALGADGLFMDTPETANPWHGYGWTAPGMRDLIRKLREALPGKYLVLNRGLFFFDPDHPFHYAANPRKYLDAVVFESYYTGSDYTAEAGGNGSWRANPFFLSNKYVTAPRLNAELGRYDSFGTILHIDYAADPARIAQTDPVFYQRVLRETAVEQGWVPQIADRLLSLAPATALDNPAPADRAPPHGRTPRSDTSTIRPAFRLRARAFSRRYRETGRLPCAGRWPPIRPGRCGTMSITPRTPSRTSRPPPRRAPDRPWSFPPSSRRSRPKSVRTMPCAPPSARTTAAPMSSRSRDWPTTPCTGSPCVRRTPLPESPLRTRARVTVPAAALRRPIP